MGLQNRLREVRKRKGLTQQELAKRAGVTRQSIISIEKGRYVPSVALALKIANILRVPLDSIFWLTGKESD